MVHPKAIYGASKVAFEGEGPGVVGKADLRVKLKGLKGLDVIGNCILGLEELEGTVVSVDEWARLDVEGVAELVTGFEFDKRDPT